MRPVPTTSARSSLWLDSAPGAGYPTLAGDVDVDVAVLGGGIAGITTALLLARAGARVAVLEAATVASGVTGTTTAKVSALQGSIYSTLRRRFGAPTPAAYAAASVAGVELVAALAAELGIDCELERRPAYTYAPTVGDIATVEREFRAAEAAGLAVSLVDRVDEAPFPLAAAVRLDGQLQLHPVRYVRGLAAAAAAAGAQIFEHTRATAVSDGSPCTVRAAGGQVRAEHVVVATHYPILDRGLYFARLEPQRSYCLAVRTSGPAVAGMYLGVGSPSRSVRSWSGGVIIGGEGHPPGSAEAQPARFDRLERFARDGWDVQEVTHRWSAQDPVSYDHLPFAGPYHPATRRVWVATGFGKWGLSGGTVAAQIIAERIAGPSGSAGAPGAGDPGGATDGYADIFDPMRLSLTSSPDLARLGARFAAEFTGDRLKPAQVASVDDVPSGAGRIVRSRLGKVGVYRDTDGEVHAVSVRCPHMGCLLRFNAAETSWDCPCHGSRFDVDGAVLEGPAVSGLTRRDVEGS